MFQEIDSHINYDLCIQNIAKTNQGMETLISRARERTETTVTFKLGSPTYYPHFKSEIRQDYQRYYGLLDKLRGHNVYKGLHPNEHDIRVDCGDVKGTVTVHTDRKGPFYIAAISIEEMDPTTGRECDLEQKDMVRLFISSKALTPWEHIVEGVGNLYRDDGFASVYTVDAEGSKWSLHLAPYWYDFDAPNRGFPVRNSHPDSVAL